MYGLLGTLSREAEHTEFKEPTLAEDIMAEAAYDEAAVIAHESEVSAMQMLQGSAIADHLEDQAAYGEVLLADAGSINKSTVALARESMTLAVVALGGVVSEEYLVSNEAMEASPAQAMEVTNEGVKDVAKKIYAGIKMLFAKIALQIKKLVAKLVVALNGTGKKAEKLLAKFKENKAAKPTKAKFEPEEAEKIIRSTMSVSASSEFDDDSFDTNFKAVVKWSEGFDTDIDAIEAAMKDNAELSVIDAVQGVSPKSIKMAVVKDILKAKGNKSAAKESLASLGKGLGFVAADVTKEQYSDLNVDSGEFAVFLPLFVKGNSVHGALFHTKEAVDVEKLDLGGIANLVSYKNSSYTYMTDAEVTEKSKNSEVMDRGEILATLTDMKTASKDLKKFSDSRLKELDTAMKDINKAASAAPGLAILNRLRTTEHNKIRMFIAGNYISSIFAEAQVTRSRLHLAVAHIDMYK